MLVQRVRVLVRACLRVLSVCVTPPVSVLRGPAAGLALQLVLLLMFWLSTPMLDTLRRSVPVVLVTVFAGQKALCAHCDATQAPMKSKSE